MRLVLAVLLAFATFAQLSIAAHAQDAPKEPAAKPAAAAAKPAAAKQAPKAASKSVLLCPQQKGGDKVNVTCNDGEKCCYHPLFDNGSCVPQAEGCMGIINPLPRVQR
jgi:hypothetical protein